MAIPVIVISGCLGAGKTTLLNHLLGRREVLDRHPAVIVNEFGALGIDGRLVRQGPYRVYEINKGSLFCVCTRVDFYNVLRELAGAETGPAVVLIEATGIAEPADMESMITEPALAEAFGVQANICVVDAVNFIPMAAFMRSALRQVAWADGLIINKADRVSRAELDKLHAVLANLNGRAGQVVVEHGRIPAGFLEELAHTHSGGEVAKEPPANLAASAFESEVPVERERFEAMLGKLGDKLLRLKGHIRLADGRFFVEWAGESLSYSPPRSESPTATAVSIIVWGMTKGELDGILSRY